MITISKDNNNQGATEDAKQSTQPLKTDQQILDELRQSSSGGGQKRRGVGLTAFVILLAIVISVFTALNNRAEDESSDDTAENTVVAQHEDQESDDTDADVEEDSTTKDSEVVADDTVLPVEETVVIDADGTVDGEAVGELPNDDSSHTDSSFTELAHVGEGVTHLARRALHGYLSEQQISDLGQEQKIYVEDYLAKNSVPVYLAIGEGRTFDATLIDEAITNARALTAAEIGNLSYYASLVPGL